MSVPPPSNDIRALLAEDQWIRRLAARLVGDPAAADDLAQEAYLTALSSAAAPRSARAWLGGVVRNLWRDRARSGARRARRERIAARPEATPSSAELAAEVEIRKRVADAVLALDEPLRSTVVLRFFRDRSLPSISAADGVSVSTVHARLERALAQLRAELDRAHGGREAWAALLIPLAQPAGAATLEVIAMASALKVGVSVLLLGGGAAWWWSREARAVPPRTEAAAPAPTVERAQAPSLVLEPTAAVREEHAPAPAVSSAPPATVTELPTIAGFVLDAQGRAVGGAEVGWSDAGAGDELATSLADGGFRLALSGRTIGQGGRIVCLSPRLVTLFPGQISSGWRLVVGPRDDFSGTVVDEAGAVVAGAELEFGLKEGLFRVIGMHAFGTDEEDWSTHADALGRFELRGVSGGPNVELVGRAQGFMDAHVELPEGGALDLVVVLKRRALVELTGVVIDPVGAPVPGASVSAGREIVTTDALGRFALPWSGGNGHYFFDQDKKVWREEGAADGARVIALKQGYLPAEETLRERDLALPFVLELGPAPLCIRGKVLDPEGRACAGTVVWVRDPTRFARERMNTGDGQYYDQDRHVESLLGGTAAVAAADGTFVLDDLMARAYSIAAFDPRTCSRAGPWQIEAGTSDVELAFVREPTARVAGRIVSAHGLPWAGLRIEPQRSASGTDEAPQLHGATYDATTDAEGRFEFAELATSGTTLFLSGNYAFLSVDLASYSDLAHLEIVVPAPCELQVELTDPALADRARALDPDGKALETREVAGSEQGFVVTMGTEAELVDGRSRLLLVAETAVTLVLYRGDEEVLRLPLELDPERRTVVRR